MNEEIILKTVPPELTGRLDKVISILLLDSLSRSHIKALIDDGRVFVNGKSEKASFKASSGDEIRIILPPVAETEIKPEDIPLDILYEDEDVIVVNKPKGMVVHPAAGHVSGTLVNALLYHCDNLSGINGELRPGIVHRIDKDTTGVLIACKNDNAHRKIAEQLEVHSITRRYQAIVYNCFKTNEGTVDAPIGRHPYDRKKMAINRQHGKKAVTHFTVLHNYHVRNSGGFAHIECRLETGRTHQIRVHMASLGHPLLGDEVYGPAKDPFHLMGQALHAEVLGFIHPRTGEYMEFHAPLPEYFTELLDKLKKIEEE